MKQTAIFVCAFAVLFQLYSGAYASGEITSDTSGTRVISDISSIIGSWRDRAVMIRKINTAIDDAIEGITEIVANFDVLEEGTTLATEVKEIWENTSEEISEIMHGSLADLTAVPEQIKTIVDDALEEMTNTIVNSGLAVDGSTAVKDIEEILQNLIETIIEAIDA